MPLCASLEKGITGRKYKLLMKLQLGLPVLFQRELNVNIFVPYWIESVTDSHFLYNFSKVNTKRYECYTGCIIVCRISLNL